MMLKQLIKPRSVLLRLRSSNQASQLMPKLPMRYFTTEESKEPIEQPQKAEALQTDKPKQQQHHHQKKPSAEAPKVQSSLFKKKENVPYDKSKQQPERKEFQPEQKSQPEAAGSTDAKLEQIINKYKQIEGQWSMKDIDNFVQDLTGEKPLKTTQNLQYSAIKQLRDGDISEKVNPLLASGMEEAHKNLSSYQQALKGEDIKWRKDKFDTNYAKFIQKYLISQKAKGVTQLDSGVLKDLHFITTKYLELLGSNEFNTYMSQVINNKLGLENNTQFQALIIDLMINSMDTNSQGKVRAIPLEKFMMLLLQLDNPAFYQQLPEVKKNFLRDLSINYGLSESDRVIQGFIENPEFMLHYTLVSMAKNFNFFGSVDNYMKEFARITMSLKEEHKHIQSKLEESLNKEICIGNILDQTLIDSQELSYKSKDYAVHHNVLAQATFQFLPKSMKLEQLNLNKEMYRELNKISELKNMLKLAQNDPMLQSRLLGSSKEFFSILDEVDSFDKIKGIEVANHYVFDRLKKTQFAINHEAEQSIQERFGIKGVSLENIEQVYNPLISGFATMQDARAHLIKKGMTADLADQLAKRYINKMENSNGHFCSVMDLFNAKKDNSKSLNALLKSQMQDVRFEYQTWNDYLQGLASKEVKQKLYQALNNSNQSSAINYLKGIRVSTHIPIRPSLSARGFSSKLSKEQQKEKLFEEEYLSKQQQSQDDKASGNKGTKFFEYIKKIEQPTGAAAQQEGNYDLNEFDISFEKISRAQDLTSSAKPATSRVVTPQMQKEIEQNEENIARNEREKYVLDSKKKYNYNFFKNFAFTGPDSMKLSQKSLEEYIIGLENPQDIQMLITSMVNSSYELNALIPNMEMLFYRIFCSPITTKEERKGRDKDNVLIGNIFAQKKVPLTYFGYKSLLESLVLEPKKKHLKKVIAHLSEFEDKDKLDPALIEMIVRISIEQKYPVLLGKTIKYFMQNGYNVPVKSFQDFIIFLEKCKGYEEDAKRFVFLTSETENLDFNYDLIRPIFIRNLKLKTGNEVLQLFEQIRKNIKLNRASRNLTPEEKTEKLRMKKKEFYDGLLKDMIGQDAQSLAQIVYSEKQREKFEVTLNDQLTGLQIFASSHKLDEFLEIFNKIITEEGVTLTQPICEQVSINLMEFDSEKDKFKRIEMAEKLLKRTLDSQVVLSAKLFDSLVFIFTEAQQWKQLMEILNNINPKNCQPEIKTVNYMKKNLLYCFETQMRGMLKEQIERIEQQFFSALKKDEEKFSNIPQSRRQERYQRKKEMEAAGQEEADQQEEGARRYKKNRSANRQRSRGESAGQDE